MTNRPEYEALVEASLRGQMAEEIATFDRMKIDLQKHHMGKYVVIKNVALVGIWDTFDSAAQEAVSRFGRGPYLIRQVGSPPISTTRKNRRKTYERHIIKENEK